jgi:MFS family permease
MDAATRLAATDLYAQKTLSHRDARLIILGMMLPVFMGSLDSTILATALPAIGRDLGHVSDLPWLITTYLIAATASTPLYGKISDIRGRRFATIVALGAYMVGSLICALAPSMAVLILGRVIHGLGGGGLTSTGMVVLGDVAAPKERARYYAYYSIVYTTAGACGPALGGFLADHLHWTAIFWFNIPLGVTAFAFTTSVLRRLPRYERPHRLDILGAALIVAATVAFMLAVTSGGVRYPWASSAILGLFALSAITGALFVVRLMTAPEPLIPVAILKDPIARCAIAANGLGWGGIIARRGRPHVGRRCAILSDDRRYVRWTQGSGHEAHQRSGSARTTQGAHDRARQEADGEEFARAQHREACLAPREGHVLGRVRGLSLCQSAAVLLDRS